MKTCDGCGTEFADDVELFPRLVFTREVQVARKLAERKGEEMLCLNCFLASIEDMEKKHLAMALLGLLRKIRSLEKNSGFDGYRKLQEVIEKSAPVNPYPQPQPYPNPIWIGTDSDNSVFSPPPWGTTQRTYGVQATVPASKTYSAESVYLTGTWGKLMSQK